MDFFLLLILLLGIVFGLPLYLLAQMGLLKARLRRVEEEVDRLRYGAAPIARPVPAAVPAPEPGPVAAPPPEPIAPMPERAPPEPVMIELGEADEPGRSESLGGLFERLVAGRLLVWLGGIALVLAAVFLIRYSIEVGLVTPAARMIAAALFAFLLIGAGEYARDGRLFADDPRIAQALVGAGLAVLYAAAYGSHILYGLIGTGAASAAMLTVTAAALVLALRHGAPTAVMGLIGGFLTPVLVGNSNSGAVPLLAYLALLDMAVFAVAWRRGWTWLAAAAVALSFVWTGYLLSRPPQDALAAGLFVIALAVAASLVRPGPGRQLTLLQPLALGLVQLAILVARVDLGAPAWALFAALSAASLALAALRPDFRLAPPLALLLALTLLIAKATTGQDPFVPMATIGIVLLFGGGGLALALWRRQLLWIAIASAGSAAPALIVRVARPDLLERPLWGLAMALLAAGPAILVWALRGRASDKAPADLALLIASGSAALLAGAAVWDLASPDLVAAGWLLVAIGLALAARRLGDLALGTVALVAALIAVARALWMVPELSTAMLTALVGEPVLAADLPRIAAALTALALPALLLAALRVALPQLPFGGRRALPAAAGLFAVAAAYVLFKQGFGLADDADFVARGLLERTLVTQALFVAGWLLGAGIVRPPRIELDLARLGGTVLTALAAARLIWFDLIVHNPAFSDQYVGTLPVLNLILPAYLLSALWLYAARRRADAATRSGFWLAAFLAALIAGIALLVRQAFQGPILTGPVMLNAEYYSYSLAALLLAIALIGAGIRLPDKALRLAGLLLLTAAIIKTFGFDALALEGLLRIFSFLFLGIGVIGIALVYGRVLRAESR